MDTQNIIFDLGGVLLNLDVQKTFRAFEEVSNRKIKLEDLHKVQFFDDYEEGKISDTEFREKICDLFETKLTDSQIDTAWNAMLLDMPLHRLSILENLAKTKRLFLFSNTNAIHKKAFDLLLKNLGIVNFDAYFEKTYYSHILGMRKPNAAAFEHILKENKLQASQTLFIDDTLIHVEGAKSVGIHALKIDPNSLEATFFESIF